MDGEDEHSLYGPSNEGVYVSMYLVGRCMTSLDTHWGQRILVSVQSCEKQ